MRLQLTISLLLMTLCVGHAAPQWLTNTFISLVRENVAGTPLVHDRQVWHFHPDEGLIRRERYQRLHGPRGEWLIKALGEGEGGFPKLGTDEGAPYKDNNKRREAAIYNPQNTHNSQINYKPQITPKPHISNNAQISHNPQNNYNSQNNHNQQNNYYPQNIFNSQNNNNNLHNNNYSQNIYNPQNNYNPQNINNPQNNYNYRQN